MKALFKQRWFFTVVGLLLLAVLIWFAGPYLAFASYKPFESVIGRVIAIVFILLVAALFAWLRRLRGRQADQALTATAAHGTDGSPPDARDAPQNDSALRKRFAEAAELLRKSGRSLYELPWYVIIGPPGAGKTTMLQNSGLNFPLAKRFGKEAVRGVGGTRHCDWWFTDQAVLLDTAGRFTTQDSAPPADAAGWATFLGLLRKYRRRQPLNGVLVAVSAEDLLTNSEADVERQVMAIRERLEELTQELKIAPPIYFLLTKSDLIAGFREYFDGLGQDGRAQVWGTTFPIEITESGRAAEWFKRELELLVQRIQGAVLTRLEEERDLRRRLSILAFPQHFAAVGARLDGYVRRLFDSTQFDQRMLLRGVYLTSGTQEGTPIDRMLGAISRSFGFSSAVLAPPVGTGKAYFVERLLKLVIFPEAGLAGINRRLQIQRAFAQSAGYLACVLVLVLGMILLTVSFRRNSDYLDDVRKATEALAAVPAGTGTALEAALPHLDAARHVMQTAEIHKGSVPWTMGFGLYRGRALGGAAREAYLREINGILVPVLARQFEAEIAAQANEPDRLYEVLKAYLMLHDGPHRDVGQLRFLSALAWKELWPNDPELRQRAADHFEELLNDPEHFELWAINNDVVLRARAALQTASLPVLMYSRLKLDYLGDQKRALRLDLKLGPDADLVFYRKSGGKLSDPLPALYTRPVFNEINAAGKLELVKHFAEDGWVLGDHSFDLDNVGRLAYQVMQVYEQDYIRFWDDALVDLRVKPAGSPQQLSTTLSVLSGATSPLKGFLALVADNTDLLLPDTSVADKTLAVGVGAATSQAGGLAAVFGSSGAQDKPGTQVSIHFELIRRLLAGGPGNAPIDRLLAALGQLNQVLQNADGRVGAQSTADPAVLKAAADAQQSIDQESRHLPQSVADMIAAIGGKAIGVVKGQASGELGRKYDEFVARECLELTQGRYPLTPTSSNDLPLDDFAHLFADGGTFDKFYRESLAPLVDTSRPVWRWKDGAAQPSGAHGLLAQFQAVQRIRDAFFKGGGKPEVRFNLTPDTLDAAVTRFSLDVDGQTLEYRHGPIQARSYVWPGSSAGRTAVEFDTGATPSVVTVQGPWAWFRALDQATVAQQSQTRFLVTFSVAGRSARLLLDAASVRNPFAAKDLQSFRCTS